MEFVWAPREFVARNSATANERATVLNQHIAGNISEITRCERAGALVEEFLNMLTARIYQLLRIVTNLTFVVGLKRKKRLLAVYFGITLRA